jgi:hypothetical protein
MATVLTARQDYQFAAISQSVTWLHPGVDLWMARLQALMQLQGLTPAAAHQLSIATIYQMVAMDAAVQSFDDTFHFAALICLPAILAAFLVRNTRTEGRPRAALAGE